MSPLAPDISAGGVKGGEDEEGGKDKGGGVRVEGKDVRRELEKEDENEMCRIGKEERKGNEGKENEGRKRTTCKGKGKLKENRK